MDSVGFRDSAKKRAWMFSLEGKGVGMRERMGGGVGEVTDKGRQGVEG